ncbi:MAG TPA: response regulator transcription factor [Pseudonocardiaceae bacterium]|nr:response regulator transcription factor [Pseudonocardiaceae bacterium]
MDPDRPIRVAVIDNHMLFRQGMVQILSIEQDILVVGACQFGDAAITVVERTKPDVVLLDSDRAGSQAVGMLRRMLLVSPTSKVIVVTVHDEARLVGNLVAAGAHAYLLKSATSEELLTALRKVSRDSSHVVLSVSRETLEGLNGVDRPLLSKREREVLGLVAAGMHNSEIASELYISEGTVKRHLTNTYTKLGTASRISAIKKAISLGLVSFSALFDDEDVSTD